MEFERNVTTILNVTQLNANVVVFHYFGLIRVFTFGPIRKFNVMTESTNQCELFLPLHFNGSKSEVSERRTIFNQSTVFHHYSVKINLWIVHFGFSASNFACYIDSDTIQSKRVNALQIRITFRIELDIVTAKCNLYFLQS